MASVPSVPYDDQGSGALAVVRCQLQRNPWLLRNALGVMVPWVAALLLIVVVTNLLARTGPFDTLQGQYIGIAVIIPVIVGGLVLTVRRSLRRGPVGEVEIDADEVRVRDFQTGSITFRAARATSSCQRGLRRYNLGRGPRFEHAVLSIETPGQEPLSIGVADARFRWSDSSATVRAPRYVVSADDWSVLVSALGVIGSLRRER